MRLHPNAETDAGDAPAAGATDSRGKLAGGSCCESRGCPEAKRSERRTMSAGADRQSRLRAERWSQLDEAGAIEEPPDQFQSVVGGECFLSKRDGKIALDTGSNRAFPYSYECGPFGGGRLVMLPFHTTDGATFNSGVSLQ